VKLLNPVLKNMQVDSLSGISQTKTSCEAEQCRIYTCILVHFSSYVQHTPYTVRYNTTCPPSSNNFVQFVFVKIPGESTWGVLFRPPWCSLILWQLKFIRTWFTSILDFLHLRTCYLLQEVFVCYFLFVFSVLYKKMHWRVYSLADTFGHLTVFIRCK